MIDHNVTTITGEEVSLTDYRGKALLIVNVASECGFTRQYKGLEELYQAYQAKGLEILGFPCNDFGAQEPGSHEDIQAFCQKNYGVTFPMFAKLHAKGDDITPLYKTITQSSGEGIDGEVKWNFTKFLVNKTGEVVGRFEPGVEPDSDELKQAIDAGL